MTPMIFHPSKNSFPRFRNSTRSSPLYPQQRGSRKAFAEESLDGLGLRSLWICMGLHTFGSNANIFPCAGYLIVPFWASLLFPEVLGSVHSPRKQFHSPFCSGSFSHLSLLERMFTWMPPSCHLFEICSLNWVWGREQYAVALDASGCLLLQPWRSLKSVCEVLSEAGC